MTSTEQYAAVVSEARSAIEKSVDLWKQGAQSLTENVDVSAMFPKFDLTTGFGQYFEMTQKTMEAGKEFSEKWVTAMTGLYETLKEQSDSFTSLIKEQGESFTTLLKEQTEKLSGLATEQTEKAEEAVKKTVKKVA